MGTGNAVRESAPEGTSVPLENPNKDITRGEHLILAFGCAIAGLMTLIPFQFIVVLLPVLSDHFLDGKQVGNSFLGLYEGGCILFLFVILKVGSLHKWLIEGALWISLICMAALPPAVFYGSITSRLVLMHIILLFLGACNGMLHSGGFAHASILPRNYVGIASAGQATAGLFAFAVTAILMNWVYDMSVKEDVMWCTGVICGICFIVSLLSLIYMHIFLNTRVCKTSVYNAIHGAASGQQQQDEDRTVSSDVEDQRERDSKASKDETNLPPRPWLAIIKGSFWELTCVFVVFLVTFTLFPKVGPVSFNFDGQAPGKMVLLFGMHFIGDFLGRLAVKLPDMHPIFSFIFLSRTANIVACFLRLLFFVPFMLAMKMTDVPLINNFAWLMFMQFLLSFTLGWFASVAFIQCSMSVKRSSEKARMGSLTGLTLAFGIFFGLYIAMAF